jgi:hypothetical protein
MESGEYDFYTVQDSDDFSQPERFENNIAIFKENSNVIATYNYALRIGKPAPEWHNKPFQPTPDLAHAFFKKDLFKELGYFDNMWFNADQEYWERTRAFCHNNTHHIYLIKDVLYYAEMTGENMIIKYDLETREPYRNKWNWEIKQMEIKNNFYRDFFEIKDIVKWTQ